MRQEEQNMHLKNPWQTSVLKILLSVIFSNDRFLYLFFTHLKYFRNFEIQFRNFSVLQFNKIISINNKNNNIILQKCSKIYVLDTFNSIKKFFYLEKYS